jgi:UDP-N-acetyl-D-mannosaminuronic acid dehydrogenase
MHKDAQTKTACVVGLGYIGLPTAAILASRGTQVIGVDINPTVIESIKGGALSILEPDLAALVDFVVSRGQLTLQIEPAPADIFLIAVPTPVTKEFHPDLTHVKAAASSLAPYLQKNNLVILESTVPVGCTAQLAQWLAELRPDLNIPHSEGDEADIHIAFCPERVLPGQMLIELVENDRVIGGITATSSGFAKDFYASFVRGELIATDAKTAEMCKLAENAYRDSNIAFANELSMLCDQLNINVHELIKLANHHPRVNILQPGCGVGGHCIAVDPWFLINAAPNETRLMRTARDVNNIKPHWVLGKVSDAIKRIQDKKIRKADNNASICIACLGLTYKADVDDLRESPALFIAESLAEQYRHSSGSFLIVEPYIETLPNKLLTFGAKKISIDDALAQADIILILVDHSKFKKHNHKLKDHQELIDTRGIWI